MMRYPWQVLEKFKNLTCFKFLYLQFWVGEG